jgi:hypothetical protein
MYLNRLKILFIITFTTSNIYSKTFKEMTKPVLFTKTGINNFITETYNHESYKSFFSSCLIHILDLIENAHLTTNAPFFIKKVLSIFIQKTHETEFINPYAFLYFLQQVQNTISNILIKEKTSCEASVSNILEEALLNDFELLKYNSQKFVEKNSKKIVSEIETAVKSYSDLQTIFAIFLETVAAKTLFDLLEHEESMECFKALSAAISHFYDNGILPDEDSMHRIIWALCCQFGKSLEIQKESITVKILEDIEQEVKYKMPIIFSREETEQHIMPKKTYLLKELKKHI